MKDYMRIEEICEVPGLGNGFLFVNENHSERIVSAINHQPLPITVSFDSIA